MEHALSHHGVKGMKWGVRKPLGPDGLIKGSKLRTPTSTTKQREDVNGNSEKKKGLIKSATKSVRAIKEIDEKGYGKVAEKLRKIKPKTPISKFLANELAEEFQQKARTSQIKNMTAKESMEMIKQVQKQVKDGDFHQVDTKSIIKNRKTY